MLLCLRRPVKIYIHFLCYLITPRNLEPYKIFLFVQISHALCWNWHVFIYLNIDVAYTPKVCGNISEPVCSVFVLRCRKLSGEVNK
jgi:hypothetical protein